MTARNYPDCLGKTLDYEGGFSDDPDDPGNWTGCAVNAGILKGTYKGISACAYPDWDIANLTNAQIEQAYRKDYWEPAGGDDCPVGVDLCSFDGSVNSGPGKGVLWLQQAIPMPPDKCDGSYGPETQDYVHKIGDPHPVIDRACDLRMEFLKSLSTWDCYGAGWTNRVDDVRATAHEMATEKGKDDAKQVAKTETDDGGGGPRSRIRPEGWDTAEGGQGIQPCRPADPEKTRS